MGMADHEGFIRTAADASSRLRVKLGRRINLAHFFDGIRPLGNTELVVKAAFAVGWSDESVLVDRAKIKVDLVVDGKR